MIEAGAANRRKSYCCAWERAMPTPPGMGMIAPQTLLHNALMAQI
jgi:hypothetical protein